MKRYFLKAVAVISMAVTAVLFGVALSSSTAEAAEASKVAKTQKAAKKNQAKMRNSFKTPDFAFPETVERNARAELQKALASGQEANALTALLQTDVAMAQRNANPADMQVALADSVMANLTPRYQALVKLVNATIYAETYSQEPWQYDRRVSVDTVWPESCQMWSGNQYRLKVASLCREAWATLKDDTAPLSTLGDAVTFGGTPTAAEKKAWTLRDFAAKRIVDILSAVAMDEPQEEPVADNVIPFFPKEKESSETIRGEGGKPLSPSAEVRSLQNDVAREWLGTEQDTRLSGYPLIEAITTLKNLLPQSKKEAFIQGWYDHLKADSEFSLYLLPELNNAASYTTEYVVDFLESKSDGAPAFPSKDDAVNAVPEKTKQLYGEAQLALAKWPKSPAAGQVKNMINDLTDPDLDVTLPGVILPDQDFQVTVNAANVSQGKFVLFRMPAQGSVSVNTNDVVSKGSIVEMLDFSFERELPYRITFSKSMDGVPVGRYVLLPSSDGTRAGVSNEMKHRKMVTAMRVTDLACVTAQWGSGEEQALYVVSASNGAPVAGANVKAFKRDYRLSSNDGLVELCTGVTDENGRMIVPAEATLVNVSHGEDYTESTLMLSVKTNYAPEQVTRVNIFPDRSIVRPGDKIGVAAVAYGGVGRELHPIESADVKISLRDANNEEVDTVTLKSDRFGRVSGEFLIPEGRLLGMWRLVATSVVVDNGQGGNKEGQLGNSMIRVEEYKLPTFRVVINAPAAEDVNPDGTLLLKGKAMTYSGMPVAMANVQVNVNTWSLWAPWWIRKVYGSCSTTLQTDAQGQFVIPFDPSLLKGSPYEESTFRVTVDVTDQAGETRSAEPYVFGFSKTMVIQPSIPDKVEVTDEEVKLHVPVMDNAGVPVQTALNARIIPVGIEGAEPRDLTFTSPTLTLDTATLPSGSYKLEFSFPDGDANRDKPVEANTIFWRSTDTTAPSTEMLWLPETTIVVADGADEADVTIGSCNSQDWLLVETLYGQGEHAQQWVKLDGENHHLKLRLNPGQFLTRVSVMAMHDFKCNVGSVNIKPKREMDKVQIKTKSFRTSVQANSRENWSFDITFGERPASIPVMAVMTDAALNALRPFYWHFYTGVTGYGNVGGGVRYSESYSPVYFSKIFPSRKYSKWTRVLTPDFQTWDKGFGGLRRVYEEVMPLMSVRSSDDAVFYSVETADEAPAPMANGLREMKQMKVRGTGTTYASAKVEAEEAVSADSAAEAGGAGEETPDVELRPSELPVAFFSPDLVSGEDGVLHLDVDVPNFNTTWQLQLLGYTPEMKTATLVLETTATKPVMVRSHCPRYLRTGDQATVTATVFNNSDTDLSVGALIEVVTPEGKVVARKKEKGSKLAPSGSRVVTLAIDVPQDVMQLAVRAYALSDKHSDGEETWLEVLPATLPVIESTPFWLAPGQTDMEVKLPSYPGKSQVTLTYCDNPVWTCLTALPDLMDTDSDNVLSIGRKLFADAMATGLLKSYPHLAEGLQRMLGSAEEGDKVLDSALEKNQGLKSVPLPATPWLDDARGETARMHRLGTLLDDANAAKTIDGQLDRLSTLQNADGSWSWCPGMEGSRWITGMTLLKMAMLDTYGYLPDADGKTREMIRNGVEYCEVDIMKAWRKYGKKGFSLNEFLNWIYIRQMLEEKDPGIATPAGFNDWRSYGFSQLADSWRDLGIYEKATAATVLYREGKKELAGTLLRSLGEIALKAPEKGMWFDRLSNAWSGWPPLITTAQALEAYTLISPSAEEVDLLRQWLVLQRQTQDWSTNSYTSEVINAILSSGTKWTEATAAPEIKVGGKKVEIAEAETLTGAFTVTLDSSKASGKTLTVTRSGAGPAWGGVVRQYVAPAADVKAENTSALSVAKSLVRIEDEDGRNVGATLEGLAVGDRVRVTLTVTCDRDMEYVALTDPRPSCLEPDRALSGYRVTDGVWCYVETRNASSNLFFDRLPKGTHVFSYDCRVSHAGEYAVGPATIQSQYAPELAAHSAGASIRVK